MDGDGRVDLLAVLRGNTSDGVGVFRGNGDGTFQAVQVTTTRAGPLGLAIGDLNGDGRLDFATAHPDGSELSLFLGDGRGGFLPEIVAGDVTPKLVVTVDLNGDGVLDLVLSDFSSGTVVTMLGNGDGTFQRMQVSSLGDRAGPAGQVAAGDLNGDGRTDLVVASGAFGQVSVLLGNGDGTFRRGRGWVLPGGSPSMVVDDVNGDGRPDLVAAGAAANVVVVSFGSGDGSFQTTVWLTAGADPESVLATDLNGDGRPDLAVANTGPGTATVFLGGGGTFGAARAFPVGAGARALSAADLNGDGRPDLACAVASGTAGSDAVGLLLGNGDGTFQSAAPVPVAGVLNDLALADANGDGKIDLLTAISSAGSGVGVLLGNGDGTFGAIQGTNIGAVPTSIAAGDLNGDGVLDMAVVSDPTPTRSAGFVTILLGRLAFQCQ
jgi:hypothetical protein